MLKIKVVIVWCLILYNIILAHSCGVWCSTQWQWWLMAYGCALILILVAILERLRCRVTLALNKQKVRCCVRVEILRFYFLVFDGCTIKYIEITHSCAIIQMQYTIMMTHGSWFMLILVEWLYGMVRCRVGFGRTGRTLVLLLHVRIWRCYCLVPDTYSHTHVCDVKINYNDGDDPPLCVDFDFGWIYGTDIWRTESKLILLLHVRI